MHTMQSTSITNCIARGSHTISNGFSKKFSKIPRDHYVHLRTTDYNRNKGLKWISDNSQHSTYGID